MPTRYLKPGIRDSEAIDGLTPLAETLFYRLLVTVDDFGRFDARPAMIKAHCFPIKDGITASKAQQLLLELEHAGLVLLYAVEGKPIVQLCKWDNVPRAKESRFPAPDHECAQPYASVCNPSAVLPLTGTGTETKRKPELQRTRLQASAAPPQVASQVWDSYSRAYQERYGAEPLRNAKTNSLIKRFVTLVAQNEAPAIAAHFVAHNAQFYVSKLHPLELLVADAAKLRTEWITGRNMTQTRARQEDRSTSMMDLVEEIKRERGLQA